MKTIDPNYFKEEYKMEMNYLIKLKINKENDKIISVETEIIDSNVMIMSPKIGVSYYEITINGYRDLDIAELEEIVNELKSFVKRKTEIETDGKRVESRKIINLSGFYALESKYDIKIYI